MLTELIELFNRFSYEYNLRLNIDYRGMTDWSIQIDQGKLTNVETLFSTQGVDLITLTAKTYIFLTEWLSENNGGY